MIVRGCISSNYGDTLNNELIRLISGESPRMVNSAYKNPNNEDIYMCIGSVLGWATEETIVWGAGFISNSDFITTIPTPKKICAVRGPVTRDILINNGIKCPEVYGDPALLMPRFYNPKLNKKYELSIIPHAIDRVLIPEIKERYPDAHFIDVTGDVYDFIDEVIQSEHIISSALHGCITAYAYNVAYDHIPFSNKVLGNGFKFRDFEESKSYLDLDKLMQVCPFLNKEMENHHRIIK